MLDAFSTLSEIFQVGGNSRNKVLVIKEAMLQTRSDLKKQTDKIQLQLIINTLKKKKTTTFSIWSLKKWCG